MGLMVYVKIIFDYYNFKVVVCNATLVSLRSNFVITFLRHASFFLCFLFILPLLGSVILKRSDDVSFRTRGFVKLGHGALRVFLPALIVSEELDARSLVQNVAPEN